MFDGDCCDKVMQGGKEDINKSVFKIMYNNSQIFAQFQIGEIVAQ